MFSSHPPQLSPGEDLIDDDDVADVAYKTNRGCCFCIPCFRFDTSSSGSIWWERIRVTPDINSYEDPWWNRGWMKVREWSEIVAGPKWKTFIRRFNKNRNRPGTFGTFRYDPLSYALNFDEGAAAQNGTFDEDYLRSGFSARYASIPASARSSMDLGKGGASFT